MATGALKRYTAEEYLALERAAETKSEFFDGEIFAMAGASARHNLIVANLIREAGNALKGRSCDVYASDMRVCSPSGLWTYPDVTIVCGKPIFDDDELDILLNPTVLFEVLSRSTEAYDRGRKFRHYGTLESLREYVLVSQEQRWIEHFARQPDGRWLLTSVSEGRVELPALDISLAVDEIYDRVTFDDAEEATP